jgi:hypothetical protein
MGSIRGSMWRVHFPGGADRFPEIRLYLQRDRFHWTQTILWSLLSRSFLTEVSKRPLPKFFIAITFTHYFERS